MLTLTLLIARCYYTVFFEDESILNIYVYIRSSHSDVFDKTDCFEEQDSF